MARRIEHLLEDQEDKLKQLRTIDLDVEVDKTHESLKKLSIQQTRSPNPKIIREKVFHSEPLKDPQQCKVTMIREDKNQNGKGNPMTQIIGKKARKLSKKKAKL